MATLPTLVAALADRYRIVREIGAGGMATVYLAQDLRHDRDVAIKVMRPELAQSVGAERFITEIRVTARLQHPHILPLFDSGAVDQAPWYAMPLIRGESLRDRLERETQLPIVEAVDIACNVAAALDYAHRAGVVHRDIKPENILLQDGLALVADFGIGKALEDSAGTTITQTGISIGTPTYMSPEQSVGEPVDGRSDTYSLACVLYEMLVGEPPFTGPSPQAVIAKRFVQTPADVMALREGVPRHVARALQKALQRTPIDRFATAAELLAALRADDGASHHATPDVAPNASIAVLPFASLSDDRENEYFGDGIAEDITNALARVEGLYVAGRQSAAIYKGRQLSLATIGRELGVAHVLQGSVRRAGSRVRITAQLSAVADGYQLWSERYDRELVDVFAVQDEIAAAIADRLALQFAKSDAPAIKATTAEVEAYELISRGRALSQIRGRPILEAIACFEQALTIAPDNLNAMVGLGAAMRLAWQYGFRPVEPTLGNARRLLEFVLSVEPTHAEAMAALAVLRVNLGEGDALPLWQRALELDSRLTEHRALYGVWGLLILGQGAHDAEGERQMQLAIEADPLSPICATVVGLGYGLLGKFDLATAVLQRAIDANSNSFATRYGLAWVLTWAKRFDAALAATDAAIELFGRHPWLLHSLTGIYLGLGDRRKAEAVHAELDARAITSRVPHFSLAVSLAYLGRAEDAMREALLSADLNDAIGPIWYRWPDIGLLESHPRYRELLHRIVRMSP
jgi:serine/threonine-protein kinase